MKIENLAKVAAAQADAVDAVRPAAPALDTLNFYSLAPEDDVTKTLVFGHSGSGKTHLLSGPILCGERVLSLCTDFGGNGVATLRNLRPPLPFDGLVGLDFADYAAFLSVIMNPQSLWSRLEVLHPDWVPTILHWEGFSNFQLGHVDEYVLSKNANYRSDEEKLSELREVGLWAEQTDWGAIKRATLRAMNRFLAIQHPKRRLHKIVTALESGKAVQDKLTQAIRRGPLVQGAAESLINPAFDVIMETYLDKEKFMYRCRPGGTVMAKNRGFDLPDEMEANPTRFWEAVTRKSAAG